MFNFGSIADKVGDTFNKVKNAAGDIYNDQVLLSSEIIPRGVVLSNQYSLFLKQSNPDQVPVAIGDIDSCDSTMKIETLKRFVPFGFQNQRTIQKVMGWELNMSAKLDGWEILYFMQINQDLIQGSAEGSDPKNLLSFRDIPSLGNSPMFSVQEEFTFKDHSRIAFTYERFVIDSFSISVQDDNQPIEVKIGGFSPIKRLLDINVQDQNNVSNLDNDIIAAMNAINARGVK